MMVFVNAPPDLAIITARQAERVCSPQLGTEEEEEVEEETGAEKRCQLDDVWGAAESDPLGYPLGGNQGLLEHESRDGHGMGREGLEEVAATSEQRA
jgi:hypothetical protein